MRKPINNINNMRKPIRLQTLLMGGMAIAMLGATSCSHEEKYAQPDAQIAEVPFTQVHIDDSFWAPRIETNRMVSIPSAFHQCEVNGRFDNFAIAGGLKKGEHQGDFSFDDTDPYKIIEGASYALAAHYDAKLDHYLDSVITLIAAAQEPDGYLTTCVTNKCTRLSGWWGTHRWEKINSHELYNCGHLYEAAVAHFRATGKRSLLNVAIKNADLVCQVFGEGEGQIHRPGGHPIVEMALAKLYKVTGNEKYLQQARYFVEETGRCTDGHAPSEYSQDHMPILQQQEIVGHAVRAGYLYSGVADVAALTNDTAYYHALERIWQNVADCKLYITGGIGSRAQGEGFGPNYELHNHTAYCETCAAIANVYWNYRMFLASGEAKYADVYERALYNNVLSGVSLSGDRFFYDNPLESMGQHERAEWFGCACCPGNITRFVASVPLYMYATQGNDIYVNLYIQSTAEVNTALGKVDIRQETQYPWDGDIHLTINPEQEGNFALRLRIPSWAQQRPVDSDLYTFTDSKSGKSYSLKVNGKEEKIIFSDGYATIARDWKAGDKVELSLPMEVRRVKANDQVMDDLGKLAIERGPVMYCMEGKDQSDGSVFNKYMADATPLTVQYEKNLLGGVMTLSGKAQQVELDGTSHEVEVKLIPYCTWNNRTKTLATGETTTGDEMAVWIPASADVARPTPAPTIASQAHSFMTRAAIQKDAPDSAVEEGWAFGVNDQWEPKSSSDTSKPYHYWWLKYGCPVSLAYDFAQPTEVKSVSIYWMDLDHYDGNFRVPASWKLYYETASKQWEEVTLTEGSSYGVAKDQYNTVTFTPVSTTGLRLVANLQEGESGGVLEWKVE